MGPFSFDDPYAILGVAPGATRAELRRAYRRLALRYHPDRAGPSFTGVFQLIAAAYQKVSGAPEPAPRAPRGRLSRLTGTIEQLVAVGSARVLDDGVIELRLSAAEAEGDEPIPASPITETQAS